MIAEDYFWRWIIRGREGKVADKEWEERGGKWIVYADKKKFEKLEKEIESHVERGDIEAAKYWKLSNKSALCIYSYDHEREKTRKIIENLGLRPSVWEYDFARKKNIWRPKFWLSAFKKLRILIATFGITGAIKFIISAYTAYSEKEN